MKIEELYAKYDRVLNKLNVTKNQHFIFDLSDENSQNSLKRAFPGIESLIIPENGKYVVVTTIVENTDCLLMLFPETTDGLQQTWASSLPSPAPCVID